MNIHRDSRVFLAGLSLSLFASAVLAQEPPPGERFDPPLVNRPWTHEGTGIRLPSKLGKVSAISRFEYEDAVSGVSMRYEDSQLRLRIDVYLYPVPKVTDREGGELTERLAEEVGFVFNGIREMEKRGFYRDVEVENGTVKDVVTGEGEEDGTQYLEAGARYVFVKNLDGEEVEVKVESVAGVALFREHFVKIRATFPHESEVKARPRLDDLVEALLRCVSVAGLRSWAESHLEDYFDDPLSEAGHGAASALVKYAKLDPCMELTVDGSVVGLGSELEELREGLQLEILRGFIAGVVRGSLAGEPPTDGDLWPAGAVGALEIYDWLRKGEATLTSEKLESLREAVADGGVRAWVDSQAED